MLSSCVVDHVFCSWSCPYGLKSYHRNYLLSVLLLFRATLEKGLFSGHAMERIHKPTVSQTVQSPET